jgi:hypothetical protein
VGCGEDEGRPGYGGVGRGRVEGGAVVKVAASDSVGQRAEGRS